MLIGIIVILGLALLILGHEAGHFIVAKLSGMKVREFGIGFPPRMWSWRKGETEYSLNWLPLGGFVRIAGENGEFGLQDDGESPATESEKKRFFSSQPAYRRIAVLLAGVVMNFLLAWICFSIVFAVGTPRALLIQEVQEGSPAARVGIEAGDLILGYEGAEDFISFTAANRGMPITLSLERKGEAREIVVTPRAENQPGEGALGVMLAEVGEKPRPFFTAMLDGWNRMILLSKAVAVGLYSLIADLIMFRTVAMDVSGPVGIFSIAHQAGEMGLGYLLEILGLISVNLAILNLIPFPALDGGRIVLVLVEKIRRRALPLKIELLVNGIGFAVLLLGILLLTFRDVARIF